MTDSDQLQKTNGYDGDEIQGFLDEIAVEDDALASERGRYMQACQPHRNAIKAVKARAREAGIKTVVFNTVLQKFRDDRAHQARIEALEPDDHDAVEEIQEKLGPFADTPLGKWRLDKARAQQDRDSTLDELHQS